jgi:membrane protease YdiL (CAAX protease family)
MAFATFAPRLVILAVLVPAQAAGEELCYRGVLLQSVGTLFRSPWVAAIASTALFVVSHGLRAELDAPIAVMGLEGATGVAIVDRKRDSRLREHARA